ncbi:MULTISPECIES: ADP-ribosyltransferase [Bacillus cereus group]|uniref:ADP-ribosyltransferase exoenzyme family protein n=1 Tax=Bacillus cereus 03BB108 TaxID=451709 RepID=A0AAN0W488_BACCE|nr:ADP-ribosyltransferase [Bacillus cereus]AJI08518.1 ADP-ribosyltransferase exoenzyme family protein [Bacillus cereus 03BB108]EDX59730.1 Isp2b protein [Bacillus cereus 03BB108]QKG98852.1 hypothetical protein FOC96_00945 [Bacillus cereus]
MIFLKVFSISGGLISICTPTYADGENSVIHVQSRDVKAFKDREKAEAWGRERYAGWYNNLTIVEQKSLTDYTTEKGYQINKYLRQNKGNINIPENSFLNRNIINLDSAIEKAKMKESIKVYRRVGENAFGMEADSLRNKNTINREKYRELAERFMNKEIKEYGYLSTTLVRGISDEAKIKSPEIALMPIILELNIPKGTKAAYINDLSDKPWELELLVGRGSTFKIHGMSIIVENGRERLKVTADLLKK